LHIVEKYEKICIEDVYTELDPHNTAKSLGYQKTLPDDILCIVKEMLNETAESFDIHGGYLIFDKLSFTEESFSINISNVEFSPRKIVYNNLQRSTQIALFVCTAGEGISQLTKKFMSTNEPLKGFIADILGSLVVETSTDLLQKKLSNEMAQVDLKITNRYSPGYCGWGTHEQFKLFSLLPKDFCGIYLTDSALMKPVKSVSGFIGIGTDVSFNQYSCQTCNAPCGLKFIPHS